MKHFLKSGIIKTVAVCILFCVAASSVKAQSIPLNEPNENLPLAFNALKDSISIDINNLSAFLNAPAGQRFTLNSENNPLTDGTIISSLSKYNNSVQTSTVSLNSYIRSLFVFSKIILPSGKIIFRGRITSQNYGDYFELLEKKDHYYLLKKNINTLRAE